MGRGETQIYPQGVQVLLLIIILLLLLIFQLREPWQRKKGLGRRDSKFAPKVTVPLQDKVGSRGGQAPYFLNSAQLAGVQK